MAISNADDRTNYPSIPISYLDEMLAGARDKQLDAAELLMELGIDPEILRHLNGRISIALYSKIMLLVRDKLQDEFIGFLSQAIPTHAFTVLSHSIVACENLTQTISHANHFYHMFTRDFWWELRAEQHHIKLLVHFQRPSLARKFMIESLLLIPRKIGGWLIGEQLPIVDTGFSFSKQGDDSQQTYLFGNNIAYEQEHNYLLFDRKYFECPTIRKYSDVSAFVKDTAPTLLLMPREHPITHQVRQLIIPFVEDGLPDLASVSSQLQISHQHLWRKLHEEGTNYQAIKDGLRRDLAIRYLEDPSLSVEMVAEKIGYQEPRSFYKAFRKWTGMAPGEYKRLVFT